MTSPVRLVERVQRFTTLGLKFWDPVLDEQVADGLLVEAWPNEPGIPRRRRAFRTRSGVYAFDGLPGMNGVELDRRSAIPSAVEERRPFVVAVRDTRDRYVPMALAVDLPLPYPGVFLGGSTASPQTRLPRILLYSAANRRTPGWLARVEGTLRVKSTGAPAPYALVTIAVGDDEWSGISDAEGRFLIALPYPPTAEADASPTSPPRIPPTTLDHIWPLELSVRYSLPTDGPESPESPESPDATTLHGTTLPEYESVFLQDLVETHSEAEDGSPAGSLSWFGEMRYGTPVRVCTEGVPDLLIGP